METTGLGPFLKLPGVSVGRPVWGFSQVPKNERDDFMERCNAKGEGPGCCVSVTHKSEAQSTRKLSWNFQMPS